jgi:threonine/homoserine efflux transporter RhtA
VATAIGWAALGESLSDVQLAGAALVIVAVVAGQRVGRRPAAQTHAGGSSCGAPTASAAAARG